MPNSSLPGPALAAPCRILYVDDEPALRRIVAELLRREGYVVDTANDGLEGWSKVQTNWERYDLVITDRNMPNLDGVALVRRLRAAHFPGRIIVYSAAVSSHWLAEVAPLAIDAVVGKGTPTETFLGTVADLARVRS